MIVANRLGESAIDSNKLAAILFESTKKQRGMLLPGRQSVLGCQLGCILLEPFDTEQLLPNGLFVQSTAPAAYSVESYIQEVRHAIACEFSPTKPNQHNMVRG